MHVYVCVCNCLKKKDSQSQRGRPKLSETWASGPTDPGDAAASTGGVRAAIERSYVLPPACMHGP
jgi:hypothetical protein